MKKLLQKVAPWEALVKPGPEPVRIYRNGWTRTGRPIESWTDMRLVRELQLVKEAAA